MRDHHFPSSQLTVVIQDITDFVHTQEPVQHRSVRLTLTDEQVQALGMKRYESVSMLFIEPKQEGDKE